MHQTDTTLSFCLHFFCCKIKVTVIVDQPIQQSRKIYLIGLWHTNSIKIKYLMGKILRFYLISRYYFDKNSFSFNSWSTCAFSTSLLSESVYQILGIIRDTFWYYLVLILKTSRKSFCRWKSKRIYVKNQSLYQEQLRNICLLRWVVFNILIIMFLQ